MLLQANNKGTDQPAYSQFDRLLLCSLTRKYIRETISVAQQARLSSTQKRTPNCRQRILFSVQHGSMYVFRSSIFSNRSCIHVFKPVLSGHSQIELFFKTNYRLMRVKSIEHSEIRSTFIKLQFVINFFFCLFLNGATKVCLQFVIVVSPDHTHLLFFTIHPDSLASLEASYSRSTLGNMYSCCLGPLSHVQFDMHRFIARLR